MPLPDATQASGAAPVKEISREDILLELNDDADESRDKIDNLGKAKEGNDEEIQEPSRKGKETITKESEITEGKESETEDDELAEIERELKESETEEIEDDELEIVTPVPRAAILKKYPKLFEDFPYLEKAYYREKQFSEVFPTPKDAKEAGEKAATLDEFEGQLLEGNLEKILSAVKDESKESFAKLADNYLMALSKVDESAYTHVVGNIIRSTIYNMVKEAETSDEDTGKLLKHTAQILNQYVFGSSKFTAPSRLSEEKSTEKSAKEVELEQREEAFRKKSFESARNSLDGKVDKRLKSIISQNIDPKESMTEYIRTRAEKDVMQDVWTRLEKDSRFKSLKDKLWQNAYNNDYDSNSMGKIETAIISMAKTLLPSVIKKARIEALRGMGKRVKEENDEENDVPEREPKRRESTSPQSRQIIKKGEIPKDMSSKDYIMSD